MTAYNLEAGNLATVTAILRSNYTKVKCDGFTLDSCDHGQIKGWQPSSILNKIPDQDPSNPFDYIICTTKNLPDVPPTVVDLIKPAVTPAHTVIVLIQNGLNIETPILTAFPDNICLSGVSLMGADELEPGHILQNDVDRLYIGVFLNPNPKLVEEKQVAAAKHFVHIYSASGKVQCSYQPDVLFVRWRKLMYNAVWNPICALTDLDTSSFRLASDPGDKYNPVDVLIRPLMNEIRAAAKAAANVDLPEELVEDMVECDPIEIFCSPSMQQDRRKGRFIEYENLVGEALKEGERAGVAMPILRTVYGLCKAVQWRTMEKQGLVDPKKMLEERKGEK
jgi:2-dehydropantoate 2-reductase